MRHCFGIGILATLALTACGQPKNMPVEAKHSTTPHTINTAEVELTHDGTPAREALSGQIVNGEEAVPHSLPYQALIKNYNEEKTGFFLCGGSIISNKWILTAAHCVDDTVKERVKVLVGVHDRTVELGEGQTLSVKRIIGHEKWNKRPSNGYDIALLELSDYITDPNAAVASLPSKALDQRLTLDGQRGVISGWGRTHPMLKSTKKLRTTTVPLTVNGDCGRFSLPQGSICGLKEHGQDTCQGDSGGPLASSYKNNTYILGVVSFGPRRCDGNGVYTRVSSYLDWIEQYSGITPDRLADSLPELQEPVASFKTELKDKTVHVENSSHDSDGHIVSWSWDFGDGQTSNERNPVHTYAKAGTYTIKLTVKDNHGLSSQSSSHVHITNSHGGGGNTGETEEQTHTGRVNSAKPAYAPDEYGFNYAGGNLSAELSAANTGFYSFVDLDLALETKTASGSWKVVARSSGVGSNESIRQTVEQGTYRWKVYTYRGASEYTLKTSR